MLTTKAKESASELLNKSAEKLFNFTKTNHPEKIVIDKTNNTEYAKVAVTVDGTWAKCGHQSKLGVTYVESVETGEVLDYSVKASFCHTWAEKRKELSVKEFEII